MQVQAVTAELAIGELEFIGQVKQVIDVPAAVAVEYVPAAQCPVHADVGRPAVLPSCPDAQFMQVAEDRKSVV